GVSSACSFRARSCAGRAAAPRARAVRRCRRHVPSPGFQPTRGAGLRPPQPNGRSRSGRRRRTLPGPDDAGALDRETSVQTIVIANPKGGSGKTTLATNVAGWLAGKRQRVVLADADPQRSASQWLRRRPPLFPAIVG